MLTGYVQDHSQIGYTRILRFHKVTTKKNFPVLFLGLDDGRYRLDRPCIFLIPIKQCIRCHSSKFVTLSRTVG